MRLSDSMKTFYQLLINTLFAGVINNTVWFAITFYIFLKTQSVFATGIIAGIYLVLTAISGIWFGSLVDHNKKKNVMIGSSLVSLLFYITCFAIYVVAGDDTFKDSVNVMLWVFVLLLMVGVIVGNIRNIALPTVVTILIPEDRRDKANGLVGTAMGISFLVTSIISGILVGHSGMYWILILSIVVTIAAIIHLLFVTISEKHVVQTKDGITSSPKEATTLGTPSGNEKKVDLKGTLAVINKIPGLFALIIFATFNNLLGGVFMALMDAYGLSLVSVQVWGFMWGLLSFGFIAGGLLIAKKGLGDNPVRTLFIINIILWFVSIFVAIQPSIILLGSGMFVWMSLSPYVEASEQTIFQKVVPHERLGRVLGFSQSVEQAASPLTAFLIAPIAQFFFIPFMTTGTGVELIGSWFGTGPARGIALVFTLTGIIGLALTIFAMNTKYYRQLSKRYIEEK